MFFFSTSCICLLLTILIKEDVLHLVRARAAGIVPNKSGLITLKKNVSYVSVSRKQVKTRFRFRLENYLQSEYLVHHVDSC